jgi:hypothetical protein
MIRSTHAAAALLALALASPAEAALIAITNPGFEAQPTLGVNVGVPTGWTASGSGTGWWNINTLPLTFWNTAAPEGNQVAFVARTDPTDGPASLTQTLAATLAANATYTLSGMVGHPVGFGATRNAGTVYTVELLAGATVLNSVSGTGPEGSFVSFQLVFDSTGSGLVGQPLGIRLSSNQTQTAFDALALDGPATVPEPASLALLGTGLLALGALRRRR